MKRAIAFIISLIMIISIAAFALADADATITGTLTSTSVYSNVTPSYATKNQNKKNWSAPFNGASNSQRVVARVYEADNTAYAASSTWVYTTYSTSTHPYKSDFKNRTFSAFFGAKVDDRDVGPITVSGTFHSSK